MAKVYVVISGNIGFENAPNMLDRYSVMLLGSRFLPSAIIKDGEAGILAAKEILKELGIHERTRKIRPVVKRRHPFDGDVYIYRVVLDPRTGSFNDRRLYRESLSKVQKNFVRLGEVFNNPKIDLESLGVITKALFAPGDF